MPSAGASVEPVRTTATAFVVHGLGTPRVAEPPPWRDPPKCQSARCHKKWKAKWRTRHQWERFKKYMREGFIEDLWGDREKRDKEHGQNIGPPHH
jgi:hypothetical protein